MTTVKGVSKCCGAPMTMGGIGDFHDDNEVGTWYYVCTKCGKSCDGRVDEEKIRDKQ